MRELVKQATKEKQSAVEAARIDGAKIVVEKFSPEAGNVEKIATEVV